MKSEQKIVYSFFIGVLLCLFTISCSEEAVSERTHTEKIIEIDELSAKYGVLFEFNLDDVDKISISELENVLKSLSIQPKKLEGYSFEGKHIILNSDLSVSED